MQRKERKYLIISGFMLLVGAMVILFIAYVTYGAWLAKQWGIDPSR